MQDAISLILDLEWEAFQAVHNAGGRASCQDDRDTFTIMRKSQFLTWNEEMLASYLQDLVTAKENDRNLLQEKYAHMMEHTAPKEYGRIKASLLPVPEQTKSLADEIVAIQLEWHRAYARTFPKLAVRARPVDRQGEFAGMTSFETYLRGELLTYSRNTLDLYAGHVKQQDVQGANMSVQIMENTARMYGYSSAAEAEAALG